MKKKFYAVGEAFKDEESGKTLKVVEGGFCGDCFYGSVSCLETPECRARLRNEPVHFEEVKGDE